MTPSIRASGSDRLSNASVTAAYCLLGVWALYLLLAPTTGFSWIESWHNEQRAAQIVLLVLTALLIAGFAGFGPDRIRARMQFPGWWWAFVAIGVVSALASQVPFAALAEVALFVLLSTLVLLTAALAASQRQIVGQAARYCALFIASAHVLAILVRYGASLHIGKELDLSVFMLGYANPRFASALYAVLIPFVAAVAINKREPGLLRFLGLLALCALWTINLGLGTRGIWFAYLVAVPILILVVGVRPLIRITGAIAISAAIGLILFLALTVTPSVGSGTPNALALPTERLQSLTSRDVLWSLSWNALTQHPLLGLGPMHFAALKSYVGAHPHNWPMQVVSEWGLPAFGLLLYALMHLVFRLRRAHATESGPSPEALLSVSVALAYGLIDGNLVMPVSQSVVALVLGLALGSHERASERFIPRPWAAAVACLAGLAAAALISSYAVKSFEEQPITSAAFRAAFPGEWMVARFWEQGLLWPDRERGSSR